MKAPSKIYAAIVDNRLDAGFLEKSVSGKKYPEFVRKDLLLEWLEAKVYEHNEDKFDDGFNTAIGQVIDKINSL